MKYIYLSIALSNMEKYGGGFVKGLAYLWHKADYLNKRKLESAFKEYFEEYRMMGSDFKTKIRKKVKNHGKKTN